MRAENLHEAIHAEPFRPFTLMLADGTRLHVPHPESILHPQKARTAVVMSQDESIRILDVALVLGVELAPPIPAGSIAPGPNGGE
jgi:hypothetical protein